MIQMIAPFANPTTVVVLPNPEFNNTQGLTSTVKARQAIDGTMYVYKKTKDHERLSWSFLLTPAKAEEVKAAIDYYVGDYIRFVDSENLHWKVLLTNETFSFISQVRDNWIEVQLEFEGVRV